MNTVKIKWIKNGQFVLESSKESFFVLILVDIFIHVMEKICKDITDDVCSWDKDRNYWREVIGTDGSGSPGLMGLI